MQDARHVTGCAAINDKRIFTARVSQAMGVPCNTGHGGGGL